MDVGFYLLKLSYIMLFCHESWIVNLFPNLFAHLGTGSHTSLLQTKTTEVKSKEEIINFVFYSLKP